MKYWLGVQNVLTGSFVYGEDCTVEEGKGYTS